MLAIQFENARMLKCGWCPTSSDMACFAGSSLCTSMPVIFLMAANTGGRGTLELKSSGVAALAIQLAMLAIQNEHR